MNFRLAYENVNLPSQQTMRERMSTEPILLVLCILDIPGGMVVVSGAGQCSSSVPSVQSRFPSQRSERGMHRSISQRNSPASHSETHKFNFNDTTWDDFCSFDDKGRELLFRAGVNVDTIVSLFAAARRSGS